MTNDMEHLKQETVSGAQLNMDALYQICPQCFTESKDPKTGEVKHTVDFDKLRLLLGDNIAEGDERYDFTWVGKRAALQEAAKPIRKTLRPCPEESVDWENTKNLYIEGDNLEVLKLLQNSYMGKVKMIYIDPPYNTGNDFVYHDDFHQSKQDYDLFSGDVNEEGERLVKNTTSNGRFHSDWCSMMYSRLMVARSLLTDDGVIYISIDDNEINNAIKICDEVFGATNKIASLITINNPRGRQSDTFYATVHEYLLCYCKDIERASINGMSLTDEQKLEYSLSDDKGAYRLLGLRQRGVASLREDRPEMFFPIYVNPQTHEVSLENKDGWETVIPKKSDGREGRWMWGKQKCLSDSARLVAKYISKRGEYDIFVKDYLDKGDKERTRKFKSVLDDKLYNNQNGTQEVKALLGGEYMSFPKSMEYLKAICQMATTPNSITLDFFSGSATTAHAIMKLNSEDGGNRRFIMVQLPEYTSEKSEKEGFKTICEIGKERIRRAGKKILEEQKAKQGDLFEGEQKNLDVGFRVFKCADSNMKDVYYTPADYNQQMLFDLEDNIKEDRNDLDLLFGCMLDWGVTLDLPLRTEKVDGVNIHIVNEGDLVACFERHIPESVIDHIASLLPMRVVLRDSCFDEAKEKMNFFEIFKQRTGWSEEEIRKNVKVI